MSYALGKYAWSICDRCGFRIKYLDRKKEWTGLYVCSDCLDCKPCEASGSVVDAQALHQPRPDIPLNTYYLTAEAGAYEITGVDAVLTLSITLTIDRGSYTLTGNDAALRYTQILTAEPGSYILTGKDQGLIRTTVGNFVITANHGEYNLTGQDAILKHGYKLPASAGSYALTGQAATLSLGKLRVNQAFVEVLYGITPTVRATQEFVEVIYLDGGTPANVRVTQEYVEVIYKT